MYDRRHHHYHEAATPDNVMPWATSSTTKSLGGGQTGAVVATSPRAFDCKWNGCHEVFTSLSVLRAHLSRAHLHAEHYNDSSNGHYATDAKDVLVDCDSGYSHRDHGSYSSPFDGVYANANAGDNGFNAEHRSSVKRPSPLDILGHVASMQSSKACTAASSAMSPTSSAAYQGKYSSSSTSAQHQSSRPWAIPHQHQYSSHPYNTVERQSAYSPRNHNLPATPRFGDSGSRHHRFEPKGVSYGSYGESYEEEKPLSAPVRSAHGFTARMENEYRDVTGDYYTSQRSYKAGPYDSVPTRAAGSAGDAPCEHRNGKYSATSKPVYGKSAVTAVTDDLHQPQQQSRHVDTESEPDLFEFCVGLKALPSNVSMVPFD